MQTVLCHAWISLSIRSFSILAVGGIWTLGLLIDSLALCLVLVAGSSLAYLFSIAARQHTLGLKRNFKQTLAEIVALIGLLLALLTDTQSLLTVLVTTYGLLAVINSVIWFGQSADKASSRSSGIDSAEAETAAMVCVCHLLNAAMIGVVFPFSSAPRVVQIQELAPILGGLSIIVGIFSLYVCALMFYRYALNTKGLSIFGH